MRPKGRMHVRAPEDTNNFTILRLALALMVVFGHFKLLGGVAYPRFPFNLADAAVYAFFVVSGFLIAGSFERSHGTLPFYTRRVFRLVPMYATVVLLQTVLLLAFLPNGPFSALPQTARYLAANLSFANFAQTNIAGVLDPLRVPNINPSLWTLKIEMSFYLIVPLIWVGVRRWGWPVLAAIFVLSAVYFGFLNHIGEYRYAKQLPGQLQYFVVGMALYRYGKNIRVPRPLATLVTVGFFAVWTYGDPLPSGLCPLVVGAFTFCVALRMPVVRMRTDMSYSVYLLHGPLIQTALLTGLYVDDLPCLAAIVAAVMVLAYVTERLVERPGTEFGKRLSRWMANRAAAMPAPRSTAAVQH